MLIKTVRKSAVVLDNTLALTSSASTSASLGKRPCVVKSVQKASKCFFLFISPYQCLIVHQLNIKPVSIGMDMSGCEDNILLSRVVPERGAPTMKIGVVGFDFFDMKQILSCLYRLTCHSFGAYCGQTPSPRLAINLTFYLLVIRLSF